MDDRDKCQAIKDGEKAICISDRSPVHRFRLGDVLDFKRLI
jgi:hypothetical protein